jgi:hypothetical protein
MQIAITAVELRHGCAPCISGCLGTGNSTGPLLGWQRPKPSYTGTLPIAPFFLRSNQPRYNPGEIGNPAPTWSGCVSGGSPPPIRRMVPAERTRKRLVSRITGVGTGRPFPAIAEQLLNTRTSRCRGMQSSNVAQVSLHRCFARDVFPFRLKSATSSTCKRIGLGKQSRRVRNALQMTVTVDGKTGTAPKPP